MARQTLYAEVAMVLTVLTLSESAADGLTSAGDQMLYETYPSLQNRESLLGSAVATGDFNNDGFCDLAVGIPYLDGVGHTNEGGVYIFNGDTNGLITSEDAILTLSGGNINTGPGNPSYWAGSLVGASLSSGDFNGDSIADLAIGAPGEDCYDGTGCGAVYVLYGSESGLNSYYPPLYLDQDEPSVQGSCEDGDEFGTCLAAGDFDNDGYCDLAVGVPGEDVETGGRNVVDGGVVHIFYGSSGGISATGNAIWHQDDADMKGTVEVADHFGFSLAAGNFDNDGYDDVAVGIPYENVEGMINAGAVQILYGSSSGINGRDGLWHQNDEGIKGTVEIDDLFGWALAAGDFNGDSKDDLAIGIPHEDITGTWFLDIRINAGAVQILYGSSGGLSSTDQLWHQDDSGIKGTAENYDEFGYALTAGDFNGDGADDLAIGIPYENVGGTADAGAVQVLYGSRSYLTSADQIWHQDDSGIKGGVEEDDRLGRALAAGDFNGDGNDDLAIGVPYENVEMTNDGAVNVLYGAGYDKVTGTTSVDSIIFDAAVAMGATSNWPPDVDAGADQTIDISDQCTAQVTLDASASVDPEGSPLTFLWTGPFGTVSGPNPVVDLDVGIHEILLTADDGAGGIGMSGLIVAVRDTSPPIPDIDPLPTDTIECFDTLTAPTATGRCIGSVEASTTDPLTYSQPGTYTVAWLYDNGYGNQATQTQTIVVQQSSRVRLPGMRVGSGLLAEIAAGALEVTVCDLSGRCLYRHVRGEQRGVSGWRPGANIVYYVRARYEGKTVTQRFVAVP